MPEATFTGPDLTTLLGLDAMGLTAVGQLPHSQARADRLSHADRVRGPVLQGLRGSGAGSWDGGPAPGPRACGMEAHAAGGTPAALRLHPLPPGVEAGRLHLGWAQSAADPLGSRVGAAGPCPGAHVGLPGSSCPGDLLAHRQQRIPGPGRAGHHRQPSPLRRRRGPLGR